MKKMSLSVAAAAVLAMTAVTSGFAAELPTYEKAGFHRSNVVDTPDGPALLMVRNP